MTRLAAAVLATLLVAGPASAQVAHHIAVTFEGFSPEHLVIAEGDTVVWHNVDGVHDIDETTGGNQAGFGIVAGSGWTYPFVFEEEGRYTYVCSLHHFMMGSVTVRASAPAFSVARPEARQVVRAGEMVGVTWVSRGIDPGSPVRLRLVQQGRGPITLLASTPNDGEAAVTVPLGTLPGVGYQIELVGPLIPSRAPAVAHSAPFVVSVAGE